MNTKTKLYIALGVFVVFVILPLAGYGLRIAFAPVKGVTEAAEQVFSGGRMVYDYERFFNLCAAVQGFEDKIDAQKELMKVTTSDDQKNMILVNLSGLTSQRANAVREFNAKSKHAMTTARWKSDGLPSKLPPANYDGLNKTYCE